MKCTFTYDHYKEILHLFRKKGYNTVSFSSFEPKQPYQLILRHDIDFLGINLSILTDMEMKIGFQSINHFLMTSEVYNINSLAVKSLINRLRKNGHHLGLHIDPTLFSPYSSKQELQNEFKNLINTANIYLGPLDSYSFHRPAIIGTNKDLFPENFPFQVPKCAYSDEFTKSMIYRSDSRREWQDGCICQEIKDLDGRSLQLLIHANWWDLEEINREQNLKNYVNTHLRLIKSYLANNLSFLPESKISLKDFFIG